RCFRRWREPPGHSLVRRLIKKPAVSDLFGLAGREWLREVELPAWERETVDGCLRARSSSSTGDRRGREAGRPRRVDLIADQAADDGPRGYLGLDPRVRSRA